MTNDPLWLCPVVSLRVFSSPSSSSSLIPKDIPTIDLHRRMQKSVLRSDFYSSEFLSKQRTKRTKIVKINKNKILTKMSPPSVQVSHSLKFQSAQGGVNPKSSGVFVISMFSIFSGRERTHLLLLQSLELLLLKLLVRYN